VLIIFLGVLLVVGAGYIALTSKRGTDERTVTALRRGIDDDLIDPEPVVEPASPIVGSIATLSRKITPAALVHGLETRVGAAGLQGSWSMENLFALKLVLGGVCALLFSIRLLASPTPLTFLWAALMVFGAWYLPDLIASQRADERRRKIQHELPDTMDQLTIAVEAGLGFESALARVAKQGTGPLAEELRRTLQDIQLGMARGAALDALGARTDVADLRRFVSAARQAERHGLPIASVLRTQAIELRDKRRQRAEEHAMKIPVKVLFPLVFCILPTLFIVVLGPGVIRFVHAGGI
jgi:tight adherence protein C